MNPRIALAPVAGFLVAAAFAPVPLTSGDQPPAQATDPSTMALSCLGFSDADALTEAHDLRANWRTSYVVEFQQNGKIILLGVVYPADTLSTARRLPDAEDIICFEEPAGRPGVGLSAVATNSAER